MSLLALVAIALVAMVLLSWSLWLAFGLIGLLLHLFLAGLIGALADAVVPGKLPWGWLGAMLAGLFGSWIGVRLIGHFGPVLFDVPIIPAFIGALILAVIGALVGHLTADRGSTRVY